MLKGSLLERLNSVIPIVCFASTRNYFAKGKKKISREYETKNIARQPAWYRVSNSIIIRINPHEYRIMTLRVHMQVLSIIIIFNHAILNYN